MHVKPMHLQHKLSDYVGDINNVALQATELFGVEVELEGTGGIMKAPPSVMSFWTVHNDGSLRKMMPGDEAIEYVTRTPYDMPNTTMAVKTLLEFLNKPDIKVYDSYRTSVHVHVNCLADKLIHVYNFITLCLLFDELFVSQNGDHRIGNNFCLRAKDAQGQVVELINSIENNGNILGYSPNNRYSSINFASLTKFGTVEFRSLECTTDMIRIMHWIRTIDFLKRSSRDFTDPQEIIRKFSQLSIQEFVFTVLGPQAPKYLKVLGYENMLFNGMRLAQEFAFCSKWIDKGQAAQDKPAPKLNKIKPHPGNAPAGWAEHVAQMAQMAPEPQWVNPAPGPNVFLNNLAQAVAPPQPMYQAIDPVDEFPDDDPDEHLYDELDEVMEEDDF